MPALLHSERWEIPRTDAREERLLCEQLGLPPLVARVLCARDIRDVRQAQEFLNPSLERDWADPLDIPGMAEVADRVERALRAGERIAVFGDFDVDGMTSTCLLTQSLRSLGGDVHPYIPRRFGEGYGLSQEALRRVMHGCNPELLITVDNGIASGNEVAWLLEQGVDVVVTDHHEPGDLVPRGVPVTDPKLEADCYSRELAGAGVALKLVCELGRRLGAPQLWREHTDLAALGTVSDMMLLRGENRSLVADGIARMRYSSRPGVVALAATAGVDLLGVKADDLPFSLIPRLNAAGRMGTTDTAFDLLISSDPAEASMLAAELEGVNTHRRETEAALSDEVLSILERTYHGQRVIVLGGEGWHEGVKGIVASRIVSRYHVPAILFSISDGVARGSGRSVGSVDLFHAVEQCQDVLVRFGGHAGAVGVTCEAQRLSEFGTRMEEVMETLPSEEFVDKREVTALASLSEFTRENIDALDSLQPFGQGNKRPLFGVRGVFMDNRARVGYENAHLRFTATDGAHQLPAIMFRVPEPVRACAWDGMVDLVVDAVNESWQGRVNPKLMVSDILYRDEPPVQPDPSVHELLVAQEQAQRDAAYPAMAQPAYGTRKLSAQAQQLRGELAGLDARRLTERLRRHMIGDSPLLAAQREALDLLEAGHSTLCVMATGRGKSLIFHVHAARCALLRNQASVFVYPLRALVSDQAFHLRESLGELGLVVRVLTGETAEDERRDTYDALLAGDVDVVLTTPEYLALHAKNIGGCGHVGFLVVDEAHHAASHGQGAREAYAALPEIRRTLGNPVVLAVSATASSDASSDICRLAGIRPEHVLVDRSVRSNLSLEDNRDARDRDRLLTSLVADGQKTVVYVNSREQAVLLCRMLRAGAPELANRIAFYHAGLSRDLRLRVERAFRDNKLSCIVSTSAFGEGVNLPGIRHVVLYHLPFGVTEFNQMSGRAGRDGKPASIHLLYGRRDARINERILEGLAPLRDDLVALYRALMTEARRAGDGAVHLDDAGILSSVLTIAPASNLAEAAVASGIAVFDELGFLRSEGFAEDRLLHMVASPGHVDLARSARYAEGKRALEEFQQFKSWALTARAEDMLVQLNRPIAPDFGHVVDA